MLCVLFSLQVIPGLDGDPAAGLMAVKFPGTLLKNSMTFPAFFARPMPFSGLTRPGNPTF